MFPNDCRIIAGYGLIAFAASTLTAPISALADTVLLQPIADSSLMEIAPDNNMGSAGFFNAGTAGNGNRNRALMLFDVAGQVPVGALIQSITVTLNIVREPATELQAAVFGLHRMHVTWGEGDKVPESAPGLGAPATAGDATWNERFFGGPAWTSPGGEAGVDFAADASALTFVFGIGEPVVFEGSAQMAADVQSWLDNPSANFGWMLMTETEDARRSARSFGSRESGFGPLLQIEYLVVPEPSATVLLGSAVGVLGWMRWRRSAFRPRR